MIKLFPAIIAAVGFLAYTAVPEGVASDVDELLSKPKAYVGSENC